MSLTKVFMNGFAVAALTIFITGCGIFDSSSENEEMFKIKKDKNANESSTQVKGPAGSAEFDNSRDGAGLDKPGQWGSGAQNPYDDNGTPIPGVTHPTV